MQNEEIHIKVNAIHRMQTVICSIDNSAVTSELIPYLDALIEDQDDEVLFAVAEEIGKVFPLSQIRPYFYQLSRDLPSMTRLLSESRLLIPSSRFAGSCLRPISRMCSNHS